MADAARATLHPWLKRALGAPVRLYDLGLGWVFGHRFLLLVHRGRRTGRRYRVVLEVVEWRAATGEAIVMSGLGRRSQWYRNVVAGGAAEVRIARDRFVPEARELRPDEASTVLAGYERRNRLLRPFIRALLSRLAGLRYDGSPEARERLVTALPLVGFTPSG